MSREEIIMLLALYAEETKHSYIKSSLKYFINISDDLPYSVLFSAVYLLNLDEAN